METQTLSGLMKQSLDAMTSESEIVVIEDRSVRKSLIEAAIKAEKFLNEEKITIAKKFVSKPNAWGLQIETTMEQPKPNKPVIYNSRYFLDVIIYKQWLEDHKYMFGNKESPVIFPSDRGIQVQILPNEPLRPLARVIIEYDKQGIDDKEYTTSLPLKSLRFITHREVINEHDWIVKVVTD